MNGRIIIGLKVQNGIAQTESKIENCDVLQLSLALSNLKIIEEAILNEIKRQTNIKQGRNKNE